MAATTTSRTSSVRTSKKQTLSNLNTDNNPNLTNLMLTAELLTIPSATGEQQPQSRAMSEPVPPSLGTAIKNSPQFLNMITALICSFFVSAAFYFAGKSMMKTKFDDMFTEKLPRYKNLVYGIGNIQNIDVDRILLRDDLNDQYFVLDENTNNITIDIEKIFEQHPQESLSINQDPKDLFINHSVKNTIGQFEDDQTDSERIGLVQAQQKSSV